LTIPPDLAYTPSHEWVATDDDIATVGITSHAATALGDIVFVGLPAPGETVTAGLACGEVESTKSVSDLSAPLSGDVVAVNEALADEPGLINSDPYGAGWVLRIRLSGPLGGLPDGLLDAAAYAELIGEGCAQ
jgi:glycine cleavage system H protein